MYNVNSRAMRAAWSVRWIVAKAVIITKRQRAPAEVADVSSGKVGSLSPPGSGKVPKVRYPLPTLSEVRHLTYVPGGQDGAGRYLAHHLTCLLRYTWWAALEVGTWGIDIGRRRRQLPLRQTGT